MARRYAIELWSRQGVLLADVSDLVQNLQYSMQRNEAEDLSFDIDLDVYEELCADIGTHPTALLGPYQTDVKIKRLNPTTAVYDYLFGAHVGDVETNLGEMSATITVRAFGYLNLLIDRYVSPAPYIQVEATEIAWSLIDETQTQTNGDLGMTQGAQQATTVNRDRTYESRQNVKSAIVNLTSLESGQFDFRFTEDRVFETYEMIGSDRTADVEFLYPDTPSSKSTIRKLRVPRIGSGAVFNKIYGLGSGFGSDQIQSTQADSDSQLNYGVHEQVSIFNSVTEQETLDDNTLGAVALRKDLLEIPQMTVSGEDFDLSTFGIGDRVTVRIGRYAYLATVNGPYRIERIEVDVSDTESEDIKLFFDNIGLGV
jgi:hypothetical protein